MWALHLLAFEAAGTPSVPGPWNDDFAKIEAVYLQDRGEFLVGLLQQRIVALGALRRITDDTAEVKRMRVHPDYWRRGFGQAIFDALQSRAIELGYRTLILDTMVKQEAAQRFYLKNRFRETGRRVAGPFEIILFEKDLTTES